MSGRKRLFFFAFILGAALVSASAGTALAVLGGGIQQPMDPTDCFNSLTDAGRIGTVYTDYGQIVAVPIYIGSVSCINNFRFEFVIPPGLEFSRVEGNTSASAPDIINGCFWNINGDRRLVLKRTSGTTCITPSLNNPFITLYFTTCGGTEHGVLKPITWWPNSPDGSVDPYNRVGVNGACTLDPIDAMTDGWVYINPISIAFWTPQKTAVIGEVISVNIRCVNNYDFSSFTETLQWDPAILELVNPAFPLDPNVTVPRTAGTIVTSNPQSGSLTISGTKSGGYGTSAAQGDAFYSLLFKVKAATDESVSYLTSAAGSVHATGVLCNASLDLLAGSVWTEVGVVRIPRYSATVKLGNADWSNQTPTTEEFAVPIFLDNNFPITRFSFTVRYLDTDRPLAMSNVPVTMSLPGLSIGLTGSAQESGVRYFRFDVTGTINPSTTGLRELAKLHFKNSSEPSQIWTNELRLEDVPSWDYKNFVGTTSWLNGQGNPMLVKLYLDGTTDPVIPAPPTVPRFTGQAGTLNVGSPMAHAVIASGSAECHKINAIWVCQNWAYSGFDVKSNTKLDSIRFKFSWAPNEFCVQLLNMPSNVTVVDYASSGYYYVTIKDVPASAYWQRFGTVKVFNKRGDEHTGPLGYADNGAWSGWNHLLITSDAAAGSIYVGAGSSSACWVNERYYDKLASVPEQFELLQNYPNPFNASTVIDFNLTAPGQATLEIFNIMGQRVATPFDSYTDAGRYSIRWDGRDEHGQTVATGVYLYRLQSGTMVATKKMVLLK